MTTAPLASPPARLDLHNASVDPAYAALGLCGMTHLQTGRVCSRPAHHPGSCDFRAREFEAIGIGPLGAPGSLAR